MPVWTDLFGNPAKGVESTTTMKRRPTLDTAVAKLRAIAARKRGERRTFWETYRKYLEDQKRQPRQPETKRIVGYRFRTRIPLKIDEQSRALLARFAKDYPGSRLTSRVDNAGNVTLAVRVGKNQLKDLCALQTAVTRDPKTVNVKNHGLLLSVGAAGPPKATFQYPLTGTQVASRSKANQGDVAYDLRSMTKKG